MTRSFIISFALVAMSGVSGLALSTVHNQTVISQAPVLPEPRSSVTASGFMIPEFVPTTFVTHAPTPLRVEVTEMPVPAVDTAVPTPEQNLGDTVLSPVESLRPKARSVEVVLTIPHDTSAVKVSKPVAKTVAVPQVATVRPEVISTQSSSRPMIVAQAPRVTAVRAVAPEYLVGVYR